MCIMTAKSLPLVLAACSVLMALAPGCSAPLISVNDTIARKGAPASLVAYVQREHMLGLRSDIEKVPINFSVEGQSLGQNLTGDQGRAAVTADLPADSPATFTVHATAKGHSLQTTGRIFYWDNNRIIIAVDVDHTISQTDYDKLLMTNKPQESPPIEGARDALTLLAKDYYLVYLTARPRFLVEKTREWLKAHKFPEAPVILAPRLKDAINTEEWKSETLATLRQAWPHLLIGIGNRNTDAQAYAPNSMIPVIIFNEEQQMHYADAVVLQDWATLSEFFRVNRGILTDPAKISEAVQGHLWLQRPLVPLKGKHKDPKKIVAAPVITQELTSAR